MEKNKLIEDSLVYHLMFISLEVKRYVKEFRVESKTRVNVKIAQNQIPDTLKLKLVIKAYKANKILWEDLQGD